ncbi:aspartic proteinase CDR1-like [Papaver somniferum]|uniref:aspartic proteinase CDR1-like n=1 Tax=Papaver somniferum TaxID=3469 RepID=UPI000E7021C1|nr:aspartic proteinase CDR1-like [Papaver somniferum]
MPLYPWSSSTTYRVVPYNTHPICKGYNGQCTYKTRYASGSITSGIIAEEKFTLGSDAGGLESIGLHIGCDFHQKNLDNFIGRNHLRGKPDLIAGILSLGPGQWSFLNQLGDVGEGKFSYCMETFNNKIERSDTYLRFGADATIGDASQVVHTSPSIVPPFQTYQYYF